MIDYITSNINKVSNHNNIIEYLKNKNIPFSINYNGCFLNLSILNEEDLSTIVNIIDIDLNYKEEILSKGKGKGTICENFINPVNIKLENTSFTFSQEEWDIINYTKKKLY